ARGLMSCPSILMLDEPSLGIAPVIVDKVFEIIEDLKKAGLTIIINEQNAMRALAVSDRGYVVQSGRIVLSGTNKELETSDEVRRAYLGL
ncbi:MAG: ABC transporter ATP-binding protein, partial [Lachnospiraceae bacterium]|nr:ABC transporter ATP-binding protein [Lachnospiraceae bacterium]